MSSTGVDSVMDMDTRLTCPDCAHISLVPTPDDACVYFHECPNCRTLLRPKDGDCCVLCSYGDHLCPPRVDALRASERS